MVFFSLLHFFFGGGGSGLMNDGYSIDPISLGLLACLVLSFGFHVHTLCTDLHVSFPIVFDDFLFRAPMSTAMVFLFQMQFVLIYDYIHSFFFFSLFRYITVFVDTCLRIKMVLGKNSRTDGRRSPYFSMTTVALFVALCLIGVWFLTSTTIVPVDLAATGTTSDVKRGVSQNDNSAVNYGSGNVVEEKQKETSVSDPQSEKSQEETNEKPEEIPVAETEERKDEADVATQGQSDSEGKKDDAKDNVIPEKPLDPEPKENVDENLQTVGNDSGGDITQDKKDQVEVEPQVEETESKEAEHDGRETKNEEEGSNEMLVDPAQAELLNETRAINGSWVTQAMESKKEKQTKNQSDVKLAEYNWKLCNASTGHDYIPCLDNTKAKIRNTGHYEHRERHCPEEGPICLVSCPEGYKKPIKWPESRNKVIRKGGIYIMTNIFHRFPYF